MGWHEAQSLAQALLVTEHQRDSIDWAELDRWIRREGIAADREVVTFYKETDRPLPV